MDGNIENPIPITEYQKYLSSDGSELSNHTKTNHSRVAVDRMSRVANGENFTALPNLMSLINRIIWTNLISLTHRINRIRLISLTIRFKQVIMQT